MSESRHTPGPWTVDIDGEFEGFINVYGGDSLEILVKGTLSDERSDDESIANARLIAAAPDLLEACKRALPFIAGHMGFTAGDMRGGLRGDISDRLAYNACVEALKKATGDTQ